MKWNLNYSYSTLTEALRFRQVLQRSNKVDVAKYDRVVDSLAISNPAILNKRKGKKKTD